MMDVHVRASGLSSECMMIARQLCPCKSHAAEATCTHNPYDAIRRGSAFNCVRVDLNEFMHHDVFLMSYKLGFSVMQGAEAS